MYKRFRGPHAATPEVESDAAKHVVGEDGKDVSEKHEGEVEKKKRKRLGFRDRRVIFSNALTTCLRFRLLCKTYLR